MKGTSTTQSINFRPLIVLDFII